MTTDMRYMDFLDEVTEDAVGLIREKTETYGDSWKRRGGPGAWFTVVRPLDRLEGIMRKHGGDIFAAIEKEKSGADGSALACVRDAMNYFILIEAHCRAIYGVKRHGPPPRPTLAIDGDSRPECANCHGEYEPMNCVQHTFYPGKMFCSMACANRYAGEDVPSPASGSHHALDRDEGFPGGATVCGVCNRGPGHAPDCVRAERMEAAGEVTQDAARAGGSAGRRDRRSPGDRLEAFRVQMLDLAEELRIPVECRTSALGEMLCIDIDLRKIDR